jgi:rare lipoprotein A
MQKYSSRPMLNRYEKFLNLSCPVFTLSRRWERAGVRVGDRKCDPNLHCAVSTIWKFMAGLLVVLTIAGCSSISRQPTAKHSTASTRGGDAPVLPPANSGRGGYYKDDGPGDQIPQGLENLPDAEPRVEPYSTRANRPYSVFGNSYTPITDNRPFKQRGTGSWYGKKFHGNKTSSGELYDMYKMTAAHPTLPIPSYSRVTNLENGRQIIVRINDRGPFHSDRIIDLSYAAALKLGYLGKGSGLLEVEHLSPEEITRITQVRRVPESRATVLASPSDKQLVKNTEEYPPLPQSVLAEKGITPSISALSGYYVQLGSFSQAQNAEAMRAQYALAWVNKLPPAEVVQNGAHYRLMAGPFATREKAADAAQLIQEAGAPRPIIVQR